MGKYFISICLFWAAVFGAGSALFAQETPAPPAATDTARTEVNSKIFNLIVNQGFVVNGTGIDSMPMRGSASGSFFIGGGFIINLYKQKLGLRLTPGYAWYRATYESTGAKTFPSASDSFQLERHRMGFFEVPVGLFYNFKTEEDGDPEIFAEIGGYAGYRTGSVYKTRGTNAEGQEVTTTVKNVGDLERFRYGLFARAGYKWFALHAAYRLSNVWLTTPTQREGYVYPKMPALEVGLSLFL